MELHKLLKKGDIIHKEFNWSIFGDLKTGKSTISKSIVIYKVTKIVYKPNYKHDIYLTKQTSLKEESYQRLVSNKEINDEYILPLSSTLKKL